jgi:AcrR family transcriptional regulator
VTASRDPVKPRRRYDVSRRSRTAAKSRERILDVAQAKFLELGFGSTTIASIAETAGVSVDTVYKTYRSKAGLLRAIAERGLLGSGPEPAESRSDRLQQTEPDPVAIMTGFGKLAAEVAPRVAPMLLLIARAADADAEVAELREHLDRTRLERMTHNAQQLFDRGFVRPGLSVEEVGELFWTLSSPEMYDLLVNRRGWTPERFGQFTAHQLAAAVL